MTKTKKPLMIKMKDPVRVKSGRKSRRKGKRGEYESRDLLQALVYPKGEGKVERTPMSGAWHGTPVMTGDLVFLRNNKFDEAFPFFFEVKNLRPQAVSAFQLMAGKGGDLRKWLRETAAKAKAHSQYRLYPLLMWKVTRSEWFVMLSFATAFEMEAELDCGKIPEFCLRAGDYYVLPFKRFKDWLRDWVGEVNENLRIQ